MAQERPDVLDRLTGRVDETPMADGDDVLCAWRDWLDRHGHRGVFESDIARPRFAEDPTPIIEMLRQRNHRESTPGRPSAAAVATLPLWAVARAPMAAREQVRSAGMQAFATIRRHLLDLAEVATAAGRLPTADAIWLLTIDEAAALDAGAAFTAADLDARRDERTRLAALRLPDTLHRFDDPEALAGASTTARSFRGLPLVRGRAEGRALRASEPPSRLPDGFDPASTILVARSVDAGWIAMFAQVAGVAVEIGGDLSHGSIILRELGLVSITNLGDLGNAIVTGDRICLDADRGRLVVTEAARSPAQDATPAPPNPPTQLASGDT
jgi:rifampicin phosphotransferase